MRAYKRRTSKFNKLNLILFPLLILGVVGYFIATSYVEKEIKKVLKKDLKESFSIDYEDIYVSLIFKCIQIDKIRIKPKASKGFVTVDKLEVNGVSYYNLIKDGNFVIDDVVFNEIDASYHQRKDTLKTQEKSNNNFEKTIKVKNFQINNAIVNLYKENDSLEFSTKNLYLKLSNSHLNSETLASKIPFKFGSFELDSDDIYLNMNEYEALNISSISFKEKLIIKDFSIQSKYTKADLQSVIEKERDHIDLKVPAIEINGFKIDSKQDSLLVEIKSGIFKDLKLNLYRNKLMPDDFTIKKMFGEKVHELPFSLHIPEITIKNGEVRYAELVAEKTKAGEIFFTELNSKITNISNINTNEILFNNEAKLMGVAPINVKWSFYKANDKNVFKASGSIYNFEAESVNAFLKPNLRAEAEGSINELYFTVSGDDYAATGDMKMNYEDFKFVVLKKDRLGVNKVLTLLGNIFTNDGSQTDAKGYRHGQVDVERDPTKSFFNYLWINVKSGILSTMTGNGKKDKK